MSPTTPNAPSLPSPRADQGSYANPVHQTMRERPHPTTAGVPVLVLGLAAVIPLIFLTVSSAVHGEVVLVVLGIATFVVDMVCLPGLFTVQPNEARALMLFFERRRHLLAIL